MRSLELVTDGLFWRATFFAMGSPCEVLCDTSIRKEASFIADIVASEAWRIEDKFSRYISGSIVDEINLASGAPVRVDEETANLIDFASTMYDLSDGRFDISSGVLRRVWTFDGGSRIPSKSEIAAAMSYVGWQKVTWQDRVLTMPPEMQIDLGGIGKEYAVDNATRLIREQSRVACLVNFGGDLAVTGPSGCPSSWHVGREKLQGSSGCSESVIDLKAGALATSGDTRRFVLNGGKRYGHILDPTTGWPIAGAPASITVANNTCVEAGMLCTLAMLQGKDAEDFLARENVNYWCQW